jgi:DNA modification methylase
MGADKLQIKYVKLDDLKPYENNPRKNKSAIEVVKNSIKAFGFKVPLVVDKDNIVVAGHTRLQAVNELRQEHGKTLIIRDEKGNQVEILDLEELPAISADSLSKAQIRAFRIMDNKSNEYAQWESEMLKEEMLLLQNDEFNLEFTGFKESEINRILDEEEKEEQQKREPKYQIQPGQIIQLGNHRLICADSTRPDTYDNLLNGKKVAMIYTDPPYGVSYVGVNNPNGRNWKMIEGDDLRGDDLYKLLYGCFKAAEQHLQEKAALYVFHASANQNIFEKALFDAGFKVKQQLIWQKHLVLGHSHYHWAHEPVFYACRINEDPEFYGDRIDKTMINKIEPDKMDEKQLRTFLKRMLEQSTILQFQKDNTQDYIHPTQKPVNMAIRMIVNSSKPLEIVLDPFAGSGSTLMACEKEERACYAVEIDPVYVSHIIERWENTTNKRAEFK